MKISKSDLRKLLVVMKRKNLSASQVIEIIKTTPIKARETVNLAEEIVLLVDYGKTIEQAIIAGNYYWVSRDLNDKNFPISSEMIGKKLEIRSKLFHFNRSVEPDEAIFEMNSFNYHPANLMEILALGSTYPDLQREFPIIALGSVLSGLGRGRYVPYLITNRGDREIYLGWRDGPWDAVDRFLGVSR